MTVLLSLVGGLFGIRLLLIVVGVQGWFSCDVIPRCSGLCVNGVLLCRVVHNDYLLLDIDC